MSVHVRRKSWFVVYRDDNGRRQQKHFGTGDSGKQKAEIFDLQIKLAKKKGQEINFKSTSIYIDELAQSYVDHLKVMGKSIKFLEELAGLLNNHIIPILKDKPVDKLTYKEDIVKLSEHLNGRKQATKNRYFGYIRAMCNFGIKNGLIKNNPLSQWVKPKENQRLVLLTVEDLMKIYECADNHLKWAIEIAWNLGVRTGNSELLALKWEHIDYARGVLRVYAPKTKNCRTLPIRSDFKAHLKERQGKSQTEYLIEYKGRPVKSLRRSFRSACRRAGITYPIRMYDIRHLFASVLLSDGADLAAVSKLLGHSSTQTTVNNYYHLLHGEKERAVGLLPSLRRESSSPIEII